jgi:hypothetical protein
MTQNIPDGAIPIPIDDISMQPKARIHIRGRDWFITMEDRSMIRDMIRYAKSERGDGFIDLSVVRGGYYVPMTINVSDVVTVEEGN